MPFPPSSSLQPCWCLRSITSRPDIPDRPAEQPLANLTLRAVLPALIWSVVIALASLARIAPSRDFPGLFSHADKLAHFGMYAVYAGLLLHCRVFTTRIPVPAIALTITWGFLYGFLMECLQGLIPWVQRDFSLFDATANVLGATAGAWIWSRATPSGDTGKDT